MRSYTGGGGCSDTTTDMCVILDLTYICADHAAATATSDDDGEKSVINH